MRGRVGVVAPPIHRWAGGQHAGVRGGLAGDRGLHRQVVGHGKAGHGGQRAVCVGEGRVCPAQHGARREGGHRGGGLWDGLVHAGAEAAADGDVAGGVAGLPPLVPKLLLSPPLGPSVGKPDLYPGFGQVDLGG